MFTAVPVVPFAVVVDSFLYDLGVIISVEQIRRVLSDNFEIIFVISP